MSEAPLFPITSGSDWSFEQIDAVYQELDKIASEKYGLNTYPNQLEIVTSEQMLDAYASHGMPIMYKHWSFGKSFIQSHHRYSTGKMGLAYEMVINSSPCINYLMEENTAMMQTLVIAHAAFGHNHFFANNYLFKQWTDAEAIIDYLMYATDFIQACEEQYGVKAVEQLIDALHAWQFYGVDKYKRPPKLSADKERLKRLDREEYTQRNYNFVLDRSMMRVRKASEDEDVRKIMEAEDEFEPQENILYFIEKHAPKLPQWKREIIRIVRRLAQYFYPQIQTKVMNEGFATFMHYHLMHDLREKGLVDEGCMLEFYHSHTGVVYQPPMSASLNPYALGFAMFMDIKRVCLEPTQEDIDWYGNQSWVGAGDWIETVKWAVTNFKDESFVRQFLSPKVIRDLQLFSVEDDTSIDYLRVTDISDSRGYQTIRTKLADSYLWTRMFPDIQVTGFDEHGERTLELTQTVKNGRFYNTDDMMKVGPLLASVWEYPVQIAGVEEGGGEDGKTENLVMYITPIEDSFEVELGIYSS